NTGVTGVAVELRVNDNVTAEFLDLALAENASGDTLTLSLDGGRIFDIATLTAGSLADGDYTGVLYDDITTSTTSLGTPEDFIFLSAFGTTGEFEVLFGAAGLQTPNANLPALITSYAGELALLVVNPTAQTVTFFEADLSADADFANGQLTGGLQQNGGSVGSLTGQITGAEVLGTLTISRGVLDSGETLTQGNLDAVGVFFGTGADNLAGVAAGQGVSTTNGGQPEALVGGFELSR
ncbi:MAG: transferrin-binding protein-like solute binding protein, partial [Pseudomonadota bacterium]